MPVYEYYCDTCEAKQEHFQWHMDDPAPICCGKATDKVPSVATAVFYGAGPYATGEHGTQFRNVHGKGFRQHHEGKIPRRLGDKSPEAQELIKEFG